MTFLEFFEALVGCAQIYVTEDVVKNPNTPRPSTTVTHDQSYISVPGSPSRMASQLGEDVAGDDAIEDASPEKEAAESEAGSPNAPRSNSQNTSKSASTKHADQQVSTSSAAAAPSEVGAPVSQHTHPDTPHKSETTLGPPQKSTSFISNHSGTSEAAKEGEGVKSAVSVVQSEAAAEEASEGRWMAQYKPQSGGMV